MMNKKPLGLLDKDPVDNRDLEYRKYKPLLTSTKIPKQYLKMFNWLTDVSDQHYGSCTSHGSNNCKESQETKEIGKKWEGANKFIYHNTKRVSGLWNNQADYSRNAAKAIEKWGVPKLKTYPDLPRDSWEKYVKEKPPEEAYEEAKNYKIKSYAKVWPRIREFQSAILKEKSPISVAMKWYSSYYGTKKDGILPKPRGKAGGHNVAFITWVYDKKLGEQKWVVKNSHGVDFGSDGYFYIPFSQWNLHDIWHGWIYTDLDNSNVKNMFKLRRDPEHQREIFAVKNGGRFHIANLYTLWRGSEQNKKTKYALWRWQKGADVPVVNMNEWDKLEEGDEIALMPNDGEVEMEAREERKFTPKGFKDGNFIIEIDPDDPPSSFSSLF